MKSEQNLKDLCSSLKSAAKDHPVLLFVEDNDFSFLVQKENNFNPANCTIAITNNEAQMLREKAKNLDCGIFALHRKFGRGFDFKTRPKVNFETKVVIWINASC